MHSKTFKPEKDKNKQTKLAENMSYKMIFCPEYAKDTSYVYLANQIIKTISDLFAK